MDLSGKIIGNYQIVDELGRGGMAVVYRAYQPSLNRYVAIKVLPPQLGFDQQFVKRFQREARAAAGLRHPNIVVIHDVGEQDGVYYIVMEYLEGYTLRQSIEEEGPLHLARAAHIVSQVAAALDYAHQQGFVHRDIKPSNIFIGKDDHVTLTDFGIARAASETQQLTRTGMLMGTPEYMSPEQAEGSAVDHRTDLYALGVVLYQMLVGRVPFSGTTPHATLHAVIYEPPPPPRQLNPGIPPAVEAGILKAIAKQPQQRFQSGAELTSALRSAYSGQPSVGPVPSQPATLRTASAPPAIPTQRRSPLVWILAALAAILAVLLVVFVLLILNRGDVAQTPLPPPTQVIVLTTPTVNAGSATPSFVPTEVPLATATTSPTEPPTMPTNTPVLPTETPVPPTDTSEPPTDTPNPPTDTPTATMTPSPTPTTPAPPCAFPAQGVFATLWQTYRPELGCPLYQNPQLIQDAEQAFDNGHMFWRQDNDYAYVVYEKGGLSGSYQAFVDLWSEGDPEFSCAATPPAGKVQPVRGFGAVWCMLGGPGAATGWGLAEETGFGPGYGDPMVQDFERGFILRDSDGTTKGLVYIFFNDGMRFVRVSY